MDLADGRRADGHGRPRDPRPRAHEVTRRNTHATLKRHRELEALQRKHRRSDLMRLRRSELGKRLFSREQRRVLDAVFKGWVRYWMWHLGHKARRARVCFLLRGLASLVRAAVVAHLAACGREAEWARPESWVGCDAGPWRGDDPRLALRAIHVFAAARLLANGSSLLAQRATPGARAATCGHPQLRVRSRIRATGVPIHLLRGALKLALLRGTRYNRGDLEVACNFARLPLICTAAWSLDRQFRSSGTAAARSGHVELPKAAVVPDSRGVGGLGA